MRAHECAQCGAGIAAFECVKRFGWGYCDPMARRELPTHGRGPAAREALAPRFAEGARLPRATLPRRPVMPPIVTRGSKHDVAWPRTSSPGSASSAVRGDVRWRQLTAETACAADMAPPPATVPMRGPPASSKPPQIRYHLESNAVASSARRMSGTASQRRPATAFPSTTRSAKPSAIAPAPLAAAAPRTQTAAAAPEKLEAERRRVIELIETARRRHNAELLRLLRQEQLSERMRAKRIRRAPSQAEVRRLSHVHAVQQQNSLMQLQVAVARHELEVAQMLRKFKIRNLAQLAIAIEDASRGP